MKTKIANKELLANPSVDGAVIVEAKKQEMARHTAVVWHVNNIPSTEWYISTTFEERYINLHKIGYKETDDLRTLWSKCDEWYKLETFIRIVDGKHNFPSWNEVRNFVFNNFSKIIDKVQGTGRWGEPYYYVTDEQRVKNIDSIQQRFAEELNTLNAEQEKPYQALLGKEKSELQALVRQQTVAQNEWLTKHGTDLTKSETVKFLADQQTARDGIHQKYEEYIRILNERQLPERNALEAKYQDELNENDWKYIVLKYQYHTRYVDELTEAFKKSLTEIKAAVVFGE